MSSTSQPADVKPWGVRRVVASVRTRIWQRNVVRLATFGFAIGCFAAVIVALLSLEWTAIHWAWLPLVALTGAAIGGISGALIPVSMTGAANVIDSYYLLKDRAISALQFGDDADPIRKQQVADAEQHIRQVRPGDCVPIVVSGRAMFLATAFSTLAIGIIGFGHASRVQGIVAQPVKLASDQATVLRTTMLEEIEQLKKDDVEQPELDELTDQLEQLLDELAESSMDERDMMATLSEMEQAIAEARDAMRLDMAATQIKGLAEALQPSEAMKSAAAAMEQGDYDQASEKLEAVDPSQMNDKERRAVADNLKKFLAKLAPGEQGQLSAAAQELQEGLESRNDSKCKSGLGKLAGQCKKQGNCKKIGECLACQLNRLSQCKSECRGQCKSNGEKLAKSDSPSQKWGTGSSGQPNDGPATKLDATRKEEQLSSVQGDGPSESEVIQAPEGEQDAARQFAKRYQEFRNQAEAVLDTEPLPLGHRETVRQYFESIRPTDDLPL
ncbi:MAG: hypothetical protein ACO1RT_18655 [Planctomycetaceae bacterium]